MKHVHNIATLPSDKSKIPFLASSGMENIAAFPVKLSEDPIRQNIYHSSLNFYVHQMFYFFLNS